MSKLVKLAIVVVVLLVGAVIALAMSAGSLVKAGVPKAGSTVLGVPVELRDANISVMGGSLSLDGLTIASPPEFGTTPFLVIDRVATEVSVRSVMSDVVEIPKVEVDGLKLHLVKKGGSSNWGVISERAGASSSSDTKNPPAAEGGKRFVIRELVLKNLKVSFEMPDIPANLLSTSVTIPEIRLKDIGSSEKAAPPSEVIGEVLQGILSSVASFGGAIPGDLAKGLQSAADGLGGVLNDGAKKALEGLKGGADALKGVFDGLGK